MAAFPLELVRAHACPIEHVPHETRARPLRRRRKSSALRQRALPPRLGGGRPAALVDDRFLGAFVNLSSPRAPILRFDNLTLGYHRHPAVHHLHGEIAAGSLIAVVGPNGAGKSTLLKGIVGELPPLQGSIELVGIKSSNIAYLTQQASVDASFPIVIHDFVAMGLWARCGAFRGFDRAARERVEEVIVATGLAGLEDRPIGQTSGGQLQRARFARVMLQDSPLVLLDEPYGAIDANTVSDLAALVRRWNAEGRTVITVLHDFDHVRREYPEALLLSREVVARGATADVLSEENLQRARALALVNGEVSAAAICSTDGHPEHSHR